MRYLPMILIFPAALAACAPTPAETARANAREAAAQVALGKRLEGLVPGAPQTCFDEFLGRDAQVSSYGNTILYSVSRNLAYRTDTSGGCRDIGSGGHNILVTRTFGNGLCQGDIATTVDSTSHFTNGSCSFGPFVRYAKP